jgi:hypothetical protein
MIANRIVLTFFLAAAPWAAASAASGVPNLDAAQMCRETANADMGTMFDVNRCIAAEREARAKLAREWDTYKPANRQLCAETASMGGSASYVELITCLELQHDVAMERRDVKLKTKP